MFNYQELWTPRTVKAGETVEIGLGSLRMWVHKEKHDWHIAHEIEAGDDERCSVSLSESSFEADRKWTRWILDDRIDQIQVQPQMPDRPLIIRPEMPMCLMPKETVQLFIGIPIWLRTFFGSKQEQGIEIPSVVLSNSWFGSFTEGELCYAVRTQARLNLDDLQPSACRANFPLEIRNASTEILKFERLCIRPQHLNIYEGATRLWTGKGRVSYRGEENWSRMIYAKHPPEFDAAKALVGQARESIRRGALLRTFDTLKQRVEPS